MSIVLRPTDSIAAQPVTYNTRWIIASITPKNFFHFVLFSQFSLKFFLEPEQQVSLFVFESIRLYFFEGQNHT